MSYQEQTTRDQTVTPVIDDKLATHNLFETAAADESLSNFIDWMKKAGMEPVLRGPDLLTVLAPNNDAFRGAGKEPVDAAEYHIIRGALTEAELRTTRSVNTLRGKPLSIAVDGGKVTIGGAPLVRSDVECTNGVLHVIGRVLRP